LHAALSTNTTSPYDEEEKMALDGSVLGSCASEQMEALERDYGEDEDVHVGAVVTIVEVLKQTGEDQYASLLRMRHNVGDPYRAVGILRAAEQQLTGSLGDSQAE
jgi:hypothetical protein